jgi:carotenoid 1,2-hydratase
VGPDGYAWWYLDALSDDELHGVTVIVFIGSVFSPYYAWARRRGRASPYGHCAVNVALYGPRKKSWTMTERPRRDVRGFAHSLTIGPSTLSWDGNRVTVDIDEVTAPIPRRVRGRVRLYPSNLFNEQFALDRDGHHKWSPISPCSRVEVELDQPDLRWSGTGYLDSNIGVRPLEETFSAWNWSRAAIGADAAVLYDVVPRDGDRPGLALRFDTKGRAEPFEPPPRRQLPSTRWRIRRETRADAAFAPEVRRTLEDGPFYARSVLSTRLLGRPATAIHESLSLDRFRSGFVQAMLPFRMPRWRL